MYKNSLRIKNKKKTLIMLLCIIHLMIDWKFKKTNQSFDSSTQTPIHPLHILETLTLNEKNCIVFCNNRKCK